MNNPTDNELTLELARLQRQRGMALRTLQQIMALGGRPAATAHASYVHEQNIIAADRRMAEIRAEFTARIDARLRVAEARQQLDRYVVPGNGFADVVDAILDYVRHPAHQEAELERRANADRARAANVHPESGLPPPDRDRERDR